MHYQMVAKQSQLTINLEGRVYIQDALQLREELMEYIGRGVRFIHINLSKVTYLDASGVSLFVTLYKTTKQLHGMVTLEGVQGMVKEILHCTHLDNLLTIRTNA